MEWPGDGTLIATCGGGAEAVLENELRALNLEVLERTNGSVRFRGAANEMVLTNQRLRSASRVLVPIVSGPVSDYDALYRLVRRPAWYRIIPSSLTIAVSTVVRDRSVPDRKLTALTVKDAVVDGQRRSGARSSVDRRNPDVPISLFLSNGQAVISLDSSGAPLHERGYRTEAGEAPLRETVAASMVLMSGWRADRPFHDPYCGSGTIAIEAALIATGIGPGSLRSRFAFEKWPWAPPRPSAAGTPPRRNRSAIPPITGSDTDPRMVETARRNAERAGVADLVTFAVADAHSAPAPADSGTLVTNPPYGERMELDAASDFYARLGDQLKQAYAGWDAWILSANRDAMKRLGLRVSSRSPLWNGGLDARLYHVRVYPREAGSG